MPGASKAKAGGRKNPLLGIKKAKKAAGKNSPVPVAAAAAAAGGASVDATPAPAAGHGTTSARGSENERRKDVEAPRIHTGASSAAVGPFRTGSLTYARVLRAHRPADDADGLSCAVCNTALPFEPIHPCATVYRKYGCCGTVVCPAHARDGCVACAALAPAGGSEGGSAGADDAAAAFTMVMACLYCGRAHPPTEVMCEALWCRDGGCVARQRGHEGRCADGMLSCAVCGNFTNHTTGACPSLRVKWKADERAVVPSILESPFAAGAAYFVGPAALPMPQNLLFKVALEGAGSPDLASALESVKAEPRIPMPTLPPATAAAHALPWVCGVCGVEGEHLMCDGTGRPVPPAKRRRTQCMRCFSTTHTTQTCCVKRG